MTIDDTFGDMAAEARKLASQANAAEVTPEMREAAETRVFAGIAQRLVDSYKDETLSTGKPSVMAFKMLSPTDEPEFYAGVMLHVCRAGTPKHALELLARSLHSKLHTEVKKPEDA